MTTELITKALTEHGEAIEAFRKAQEEKGSAIMDRLNSLESITVELEKRAGRPGVQSQRAIEDAEPEGTITLHSEHFKSRETIAARLGIVPEQNPIRTGEFLRAAAGMKTERKGLIEGTDPSGGYTVPSALMPAIFAALAPASSLLQAGASVVNLDEKAGRYSVAAISTIPTPAWRGETGAVAESDPAFRAVNIFPKSLAFMFKVSRELMQDSPGLDEALNTVIGQAFAKEMDRVGLLGTGAGVEPLGLLNTSGINTESSGTNGTALASYAPLITAMTAIESDDAPTPTAAIMAPRTHGDFAGLVDSTGQPLRRPEALNGWKFLRTSQIPITDEVGSSTDCTKLFVGDFRNFRYYLREGLSVQLLKEAYASTGQVAFVCHARMDTAVIYPQAFCVTSGIRPAA